jgi:hypothetical protein
MAPAYHQEDFEPGDRATLLRQYPQARTLIEVLTQ